jgi:hypothetical protein
MVAREIAKWPTAIANLKFAMAISQFAIPIERSARPPDHAAERAHPIKFDFPESRAMF